MEVAEVRQLARSHTPEAINRLVQWMRSTNPRASVAACAAILDRAFGRPEQAIAVANVPVDTRVTAVDPREAAQLYAEIMSGQRTADSVLFAPAEPLPPPASAASPVAEAPDDLGACTASVGSAGSSEDERIAPVAPGETDTARLWRKL